MSVRINENMPSFLRSTAFPMPVGIAAEAIKGLITLAAVAAAELVIMLFEPGCTEDRPHQGEDLGFVGDAGLPEDTAIFEDAVDSTPQMGDIYGACEDPNSTFYSHELQLEIANISINYECEDAIPALGGIIEQYPCYENISAANYDRGLCYVELQECDNEY